MSVKRCANCDHAIYQHEPDDLELCREAGCECPGFLTPTKEAPMPVKVEVTEAAFQKQVTDLAEYNGWAWMHLEKGMNKGRWMTPVSGPLGAGWPDLVLLRGNRMLLVELKSKVGLLSVRQKAVLRMLGEAVEVAIWRPVDWPMIEDTLSRSNDA